MSSFKKIRQQKVRKRIARKRHIRKRIVGTAQKPRLSVFRSLSHIYVQAVDDDANKVLATASDTDAELKDKTAGKKKREVAQLVGELVGEKLKKLQVETVVFDRNGFIYHGRVKELADGARKAGLKF